MTSFEHYLTSIINEHWDTITQAIHMIMRPFQVN